MLASANSQENAMLEALVRNWGWLLFRAVLAVSYGMAAFAWRDNAFVSFVYLFGFYAIFDGMAALAIAIDVKAAHGFGSLLLESLVRIAGGLIALGEPRVVVAFPQFFAAWAILAGAAEIVVAIVLRRELVGEWPLPFAGAMSIMTAILLLIAIPVMEGVPSFKWLVGPYTIIYGVSLLALTRRLHQLAQEMDAG